MVAMGRMLTTKALQPRAAAAASPQSPFPTQSASSTQMNASAPALSPSAMPSIPKSVLPDDVQQSNPLRKLSFYCGLGFFFVLLSVLSELTYYVTGINTYLLYLFAPPAFLGALFMGGLGRTLRFRASWYWIGFFAWMIIAAPFSSWKGGSIAGVYDYARIAMPLMFVVGGLGTTWKEIRAVFYTIAAAGIINLLTADLFAKEDNGGRIMLQATGTIGNSNDLAAHLLLVLPFILFVVMQAKKLGGIRYLFLLPIAYGVWVITGTASRGALIAMTCVFLVVLWRATPIQRLLAVVAAIVIAGGMFALLPGRVLNRLGTLVGEEHVEADESAESRGYLFRTSVRYTLQHPLFGVGMNQFPNYEGQESRSQGQYGDWHATHCAWTQ